MVLRQRKIRTMVMTEECARILDALRSAGIGAIPLKGVALAHTVYPSSVLRYFDDLDILIVGDSASGLDILRGLGYAPHPRAELPDWHHLPPYMHPTHGTTVELHTDLIRRYGGMGWSLNEVVARSETADWAGFSTRMLAPVDMLIHTALHARHHLFAKPSFVIDAALIGQGLGAGEWGLVDEVARDAGARWALTALLELAVEWGLLEEAVDVIAQNQWFGKTKARLGGRPWEALPNYLSGGALPTLAECQYMDDWGEAWRYFGEAVKPSDSFLEGGYGSNWERMRRRVRATVRRI